ncbi:phospholipid scramblase-related protein [Leeia aquatica]|uniref:RNAase n=1 Tax=Leeia aquatica TaxID=2725557 RepID=A0A847SD19_9NEIS|nr:phospholipid scramblase-related protein [Leeia aquatica]NLR76825.1 RNAase [Leeia aquatica]
MHAVLQRNLFLVKEHVGMFKAANNFDVYCPENGQKLIECREPHLGFMTKLFRFTDYKRMTPFEVVLRTPEGQPILTVKRGISLLRSKVAVLDEQGREVGLFRQRLLTIGGKFTILNPMGEPICTLKGKWTGWDFRFMQGERELAHVSKKWAGAGKELFTSADNYMLRISDGVSKEDPVRLLIMAAVMCIDMVLKE